MSKNELEPLQTSSPEGEVLSTESADQNDSTTLRDLPREKSSNVPAFAEVTEPGASLLELTQPMNCVPAPDPTGSSTGSADTLHGLQLESADTFDNRPHSAHLSQTPLPSNTALSAAEINAVWNSSLSAMLPPEIERRYYAKKYLGGGRLGDVFLVEDVLFGGLYALRMVHPWISQPPEFRRRVAQAYKRLELLRHPNLMRVYQLDRLPDSGVMFYNMEYINGVTLGEWQNHQPVKTEGGMPAFEPEDAFLLLEKIGRVVEYAHRHNVIHGDLRAGNIMVVESNDGLGLRLMDFGLTRIANTAHSPALQADRTERFFYTAPEEQNASASLSPATDVFSLGVLFYRMLTGMIPAGWIISPYKIDPRLPKELDHILQKAMHPDRNQRYSTVDAFLADTQRLFESHFEMPAVPSVLDTDQDVLGSLKHAELKSLKRTPPSQAFQPIPKEQKSHSSVTSPKDDEATAEHHVFVDDSGFFHPFGDESTERELVPNAPYRSTDSMEQTAVDTPIVGRSRGSGELLATNPETPVVKQHTLSQPPGSSEEEGLPPGSYSSLEILWETNTENPPTSSAPVEAETNPEANPNVAVLVNKNVSNSSGLISLEVLNQLRRRARKEGPKEDLSKIPSLGASQRLETLDHRTQIQKVVYSPCGRYLLTVDSNLQLRLWDACSWELLETYTEPLDAVFHLTWHPELPLFAFCSAPSVVEIWDVEPLAKTHTVEVFPEVVQLSWLSSESSLAIGCSDNAVRLWSMNSERQYAMFKGFQGSGSCFSFQQSCALFLAASASGKIRIWPLSESRSATLLRPKPEPVTAMATASQLPVLLCGNQSGALSVWNLSDHTQLFEFDTHKHAILSLGCNQHGTLGYALDASGLLVIYDLKEGQAILKHRLQSPAEASVSLSPDGAFLAALQSQDIELWSLHSLKKDGALQPEGAVEEEG